MCRLLAIRPFFAVWDEVLRGKRRTSEEAVRTAPPRLYFNDVETDGFESLLTEFGRGAFASPLPFNNPACLAGQGRLVAVSLYRLGMRGFRRHFGAL